MKRVPKTILDVIIDKKIYCERLCQSFWNLIDNKSRENGLISDIRVRKPLTSFLIHKVQKRI